MKNSVAFPIVVIILILVNHTLYPQSFISPLFTFDTKPPVVNLLSPDGGQQVNNTNLLTVTWTASDNNLRVAPISIYLITEPGSNQQLLAGELVNNGSALVHLPSIVTSQAKIKVSAFDVFGNEGMDISTNYFSIVGPSLLVSLTGTVKDTATGLPISGATLTLTGQSQSFTQNSLSNGSFNFGIIPSGYYNLNTFKTGYISGNQYVWVVGPNAQTMDIYLSPGNSNSLIINTSLTAYAENIVENPSSLFTLTGNVSINNILSFSGTVIIDKRTYLVKPEISGSGTIFSENIPGISGNFIFKASSASWVYKIDGNILKPKSYAGIIDGTPTIGGFNLTLGQFEIDPGGDHVECKAIVKMPYPIDVAFDTVKQTYVDDPGTFISQAGSSIIVSHSAGIDYGANIDMHEINIGIVRIKDLSLYFNTAENIYGGAIMLQIPGFSAGDNPDNLNGMPGAFDSLPVEVRDTAGNVLTHTSFGEFLEMTDAFGLPFLKIGLEIEFVSGAINNLIITLGTKIPIASTGLFITEMTGGVKDLAKEDWKILASVDVETGLEISEELGAPIKLNDFGVLIQPMSYFKGSGTFEVFKYPVLQGFIEYNHGQRSLKGQCNMDIRGILTGEQKFNLQGGIISGSSILTVKTPDDLPWYLNWAENIKIGSAYTEFNNLSLQTEVSLPWVKLAQRLTYGKTDFPWFHYELGTNLRNLIQLWKGQRNNNQTITFEVPENASQLLVVAYDSVNPQLFDFFLINPSGKIFDSTNTAYQRFHEANQTLMVTDLPMEGEWQFVTSYTGDAAIYPAFPDKKPVGLVNAPGQRQTRSNEVSLSFNDYADTVHVSVFYDTDTKDFDGSFIDDFTVVNNAILTFEWQNNDIPDGEYFIYTRIEDGNNTPVVQYAPGSILVANHTGIEVPQNFMATQYGDSVQVSWNEPTQSDIYGTIVYYQDLSTQKTEEKSVSDSTGLVLTGLLPGHAYKIWGRFNDFQNNFGPVTPVVNLVFTSGTSNNPPCFTFDRDSSFVFITGESASYDLLAIDHDGNPLSFSLPSDTLGIMLNGNHISWMPTEAQKGVHRLMTVVSDGQATDTSWQKIIVYTPEDIAVSVSFSSTKLYEQDNMFLTVRNYLCPADVQTVTLTNLRSGLQSTVVCHRVNEFDYIGQFELTFTRSISIAVSNGDTLKATYPWNGNDFTALAFYDSLPQPGDLIPPADISDLSLERLEGNRVQLVWTASGNDSLTGKAFRYDIRYSGEPITSQSLYFTANQIFNIPYPSGPGETDTLIIALDDLAVNEASDSVWFSLKVSDEMQNWSNLSNSPGGFRLMEPHNINVAVTGQVNLHLNWEGPTIASPGNGGFQYYRLFRSINGSPLVPYISGITQTSFTDQLRDFPDGTYLYALQAVYNAGMTDTIFASPFQLKRFSNVNILTTLQWADSFEGVSLQMNGLDTIYAQSFSRITGANGLVLLGRVFRSAYQIEISKPGYVTVSDTIIINSDPGEFEYTLPWYVPIMATLQNLTLSESDDSCFQASEQIIVAGGGSTVTFQGGSVAYLLAGQKIVFLPTTTALSGCYLHARIDNGGPYCSAYRNQTFKEQIILAGDQFFKIFPNPTEGSFTVAFTRETESPVSTVLIYDLLGRLITEREVEGNTPAFLTLRNQPPGLYLVRVKNGTTFGTTKIVKQ